jgi:hypothetical protein
MKNHISIAIFLMFGLFSAIEVKSQSEPEIMVFLSRICRTDSVKNTIALPAHEGDSLLNYYFTPIDTTLEEMPLYEYDLFRTNFDEKKKLVAQKIPFASLSFISYTELKCSILVEIYNVGDRKSTNEWQHAIFNMDMSKGGRWHLTNVVYSPKPYGEPEAVIETDSKNKKVKK